MTYSASDLQKANPLDTHDLQSALLNMRTEQKREPDLSEVLRWFETQQLPDLKYSSTELQKYAKQFPRLVLRDGIFLCTFYGLYCKFYGHTCNVLHHQLVVPKQLRTKLLYRIHNSKFGGHLGKQATISEFRKLLFSLLFQNFT